MNLLYYLFIKATSKTNQKEADLVHPVVAVDAAGDDA